MLLANSINCGRRRIQSLHYHPHRYKQNVYTKIPSYKISVTFSDIPGWVNNQQPFHRSPLLLLTQWWWIWSFQPIPKMVEEKMCQWTMRKTNLVLLNYLCFIIVSAYNSNSIPIQTLVLFRSLAITLGRKSRNAFFVFLVSLSNSPTFFVTSFANNCIKSKSKLRYYTWKGSVKDLCCCDDQFALVMLTLMTESAFFTKK